MDTLYELLKKTRVAELKEGLKTQYNITNKEDVDAYLAVYQKLIGLEPTKSNTEIYITYNDETYDVSGKLSDGTVTAIEFLPWNEWLGMTINTTKVTELSRGEALAHILWEMTAFSFDEDKIIDGYKHIVSKLDSIQKEKDHA